MRPPNVVVFSLRERRRDADSRRARRDGAGGDANPGALTSSFFSTGNPAYVSPDRHTTFEEVYLPGRAGVDRKSGAVEMRAVAAAGLPAGVTVDVTGRDALDEANTHGGGGGRACCWRRSSAASARCWCCCSSSARCRRSLMPLVVAVAAILNTFTLVWALTYVTDVSIIVKFLIALVGLGVAIDYALLMIFRFRDELREGNDVESALVRDDDPRRPLGDHLRHDRAPRPALDAVVPLPLLRSMSLGGMLIPFVSVLAATTLLPALLAVAGTRINSVRVMPRRFIDRGHPEDGTLGAVGPLRDPAPGRGRPDRAGHRRCARRARDAAATRARPS